jgi:GPH family glycoside/pentoside/hexuronide:cation symporter
MSDEKFEGIDDSSKMEYSTKVQISYTMGYFLTTFVGVVFDTRTFIFYETEVGLPVIFILLSFIIYGIWNMINDPFIGFLSDKPNRFWKKWGRRFPWIIIGAILYCISFLLIFAPPNVDPIQNILIIFLWLTVITCLVDFFLSAWNVNFSAQAPDKFRSQKERTKVGGIGTILGMVGIAIGVLIPPLFITYGDKQSYFTAAVIVTIVAIMCVFLMIPGIRENQDMIDRALKMAKEKEAEEEKESFWKILRFALKKRNFMAFVIAYTCWQILVVVMVSSIPYLNQYILKQPASSEIFLTAGVLVGSLVSVPLWVILARKKGNKLTFFIGFIFTAVAAVPLLFVTDIIGAAISTLLIGIGIGATYAISLAMLSDVLDEIVVERKKREEGVFLGIRTFFMRLSYISQAIIFTTIHIVTGFNPKPGAPQSDSAIWGIRVHTALIPIIIILVGGLVFWKYCDLTPEKVKDIRLKLKELNL